uniref:Homeobox domain-containing protein n=1 Tax=Steinernema glaseri TaxID=37863 RepID=A0A1I7YFJ9_9BILA
MPYEPSVTSQSSAPSQGCRLQALAAVCCDMLSMGEGGPTVAAASLTIDQPEGARDPTDQPGETPAAAAQSGDPANQHVIDGDQDKVRAAADQHVMKQEVTPVEANLGNVRHDVVGIVEAKPTVWNHVSKAEPAVLFTPANTPITLPNFLELSAQLSTQIANLSLNASPNNSNPTSTPPFANLCTPSPLKTPLYTPFSSPPQVYPSLYGSPNGLPSVNTFPAVNPYFANVMSTTLCNSFPAVPSGFPPGITPNPLYPAITNPVNIGNPTFLSAQTAFTPYNMAGLAYSSESIQTTTAAPSTYLPYSNLSQPYPLIAEGSYVSSQLNTLGAVPSDRSLIGAPAPPYGFPFGFASNSVFPNSVNPVHMATPNSSHLSSALAPTPPAVVPPPMPRSRKRKPMQVLSPASAAKSAVLERNDSPEEIAKRKAAEALVDLCGEPTDMDSSPMQGALGAVEPVAARVAKKEPRSRRFTSEELAVLNNCFQRCGSIVPEMMQQQLAASLDAKVERIAAFFASKNKRMKAQEGKATNGRRGRRRTLPYASPPVHRAPLVFGAPSQDPLQRLALSQSWKPMQNVAGKSNGVHKQEDVSGEEPNKKKAFFMQNTDGVITDKQLLALAAYKADKKAREESEDKKETGEMPGQRDEIYEGRFNV